MKYFTVVKNFDFLKIWVSKKKRRDKILENK